MSTKWNLVFPKTLTQEELMLRSKYETLRKLRQSLNAQEEKVLRPNLTTESKKVLEDSKMEAIKILNKRGSLQDAKPVENKTHQFKRPSSQSRESLSGFKKSAKHEFFSDRDCQARSVLVRGENITPDILRHFFSSAGTIWNLRVSASADSAVVTFETPESATIAVSMDGSVAENEQRLSISISKKKNQSWKEILVEDQKTAVKHLSQKKRTVYVSYNGMMTARDIRQLFYTIGAIETIYFPKKNIKNEEMKSYAFVTFMFEVDAEKAVQFLNGTLWRGMPLTVMPQKIPRNDNLGSSIGSQKDATRDLITFI